MGTMTVPASMKYLDQVMAEVEEVLMRAGCGEDDKRLIEISVEELFTNIASYAYDGREGQVWIWWDIREDEPGLREAAFGFKDQGMPYNPFARKDPDLELPIEERPVGGLGIYMTKKFMDCVKYEFVNGMNVTEVRKKFQAVGKPEGPGD